VLAEKNSRSLAQARLGVSQRELSTAFEGSPMKRAKLRGLKRNAAVVLGRWRRREPGSADARSTIPSRWCVSTPRGLSVESQYGSTPERRVPPLPQSPGAHHDATH
jgi:hypothetical protein